MKKNKLLKFISVFQIIVFVLFALVGAISLAMALFQKFEVIAVLDFVNEKLWPVEELYLYVINFFDTIYVSLEIGKIEFLASAITTIELYLDIIYTGLFLFLALLGLIFAIVSSRAASGKTKGRGGVVFAFIINLLIAGAFTAYAVYFFLNMEAVELAILKPATEAFDREGYVYNALINKIIIYAVAGVNLFIMLFHFIGLCISKKDGVKEGGKPQKQSSQNMGSYKPRMKPKDEGIELTQNQTADYMKYQDSKSANPYINGNAKLTEEDLFGDLNPKPQPKPEVKPEVKPETKPPIPQNNPFASSTFARPTPPPPQPSPFAQPSPFNSFNQQNQFNSFNRPAPYSPQPAPITPQPAPQPAPAQPNSPTNINLTIQPMAPMQAGVPPYQVVQTPVAQTMAQTPVAPKPAPRTAPKSANDAFKATPKAPTQAVARPRQSDMNLTDKLKELSALRQSGAISDDEYKALKQKAFQKFLKS